MVHKDSRTYVYNAQSNAYITGGFDPAKNPQRQADATCYGAGTVRGAGILLGTSIAFVHGPCNTTACKIAEAGALGALPVGDALPAGEIAGSLCARVAVCGNTLARLTAFAGRVLGKDAAEAASQGVSENPRRPGARHREARGPVRRPTAPAPC